MDPNECLRLILDCANRIIEEGPTDYTDTDAIELAQHITDLDNWLKKGGFLPNRWKSTPHQFRKGQPAVLTVMFYGVDNVLKNDAASIPVDYQAAEVLAFCAIDLHMWVRLGGGIPERWRSNERTNDPIATLPEGAASNSVRAQDNALPDVRPKSDN